MMVYPMHTAVYSLKNLIFYQRVIYCSELLGGFLMSECLKSSQMIDLLFLCQRGYTFVAEARTPNAILPPGKFRLRVIGSTEPLPYPGRDGVNSHFLNKEIRDYYIPNRYNVIFR